jgi:hypothetical protein
MDTDAEPPIGSSAFNKIYYDPSQTMASAEATPPICLRKAAIGVGGLYQPL